MTVVIRGMLTFKQNSTLLWNTVYLQDIMCSFTKMLNKNTVGGKTLGFILWHAKTCSTAFTFHVILSKFTPTDWTCATTTHIECIDKKHTDILLFCFYYLYIKTCLTTFDWIWCIANHVFGTVIFRYFFFLNSYTLYHFTTCFLRFCTHGSSGMHQYPSWYRVSAW